VTSSDPDVLVHRATLGSQRGRQLVASLVTGSEATYRARYARTIAPNCVVAAVVCFLSRGTRKDKSAGNEKTSLSRPAVVGFRAAELVDERNAMTLARISCTWQNWPGAPGVSQFYGDAASMAGMCAALQNFWQAFKTALPTGLTITVPTSGDLLDEASGQITGAWSLGTASTVTTGQAADVYAGNAGMVIHWLTTTVERGRRVRGRTFLVPLTSSAYDNQGSLTVNMVTQSAAAATALVNATTGVMQVWHRPRYQKPATKPPTLLEAGSKAPVTGSRVPDLAVSLRSRRT
jgi:hypothetical protein